MDNRLTEEDRLKLSLLVERQRRLQAEMLNNQLAATSLRTALQKAQLDYQAHSGLIKERYGLSPNDSLDIDTGLIERAAAAPPAAEAPAQPAQA